MTKEEKRASFKKKVGWGNVRLANLKFAHRVFEGQGAYKYILSNFVLGYSLVICLFLVLQLNLHIQFLKNPAYGR